MRGNLRFPLTSFKKGPAWGPILIRESNGLKVLRANGLAAVGLGAVASLCDCRLEMLRYSISEIAGRHHSVLLDEFLKLGSNNVTHGKSWKDVKTSRF